MDFFGPAAANSIAAQTQRARQATESRKREETRRTRETRTDEVVLRAEAVEASRSLKGNDQEEAREDHQEHPGYRGPGRDHGGDQPRPHLDVEG
ncbi:MAG: hypothetical protein AAGG07_01705 [Planctomycetota bacterium]